MSALLSAVFFASALAFELIFPQMKLSRSWFRNYFKNLGVGLVSALAVFFFSQETLLSYLGFRLFDLRSESLALQIIIALVVIDLSSYFWHLANHKIRFFWNFHSVHHLDEQLNSASAIRFHFGEVLMGFFYRLLVLWLMGLSPEAIAVFQSIYMALNIFQHSNIALKFGVDKFLGNFIVTPALHRIHHSSDEKDLDRNFGTIFSFWDRIFGTFTPATSSGTAKMGLPNNVGGDLSLWQLLEYPFLRRRS